MTSIDTNNETLRDVLKTILSMNIGVQIEIGGAIYIRNNGKEEYVVGGIEEKNPYQVNEWEESFQDLDLALNYLITKRTQDKLGNDFWPM